ncbi:MAG: secretin N-terminal domain-containing protein [Betaproteobacteria bacterium]
MESNHLRHLVLGLLLACGVVHAQGELEILQLRSRSAEQVIPILRPLLAPGGVLTGQGYQLIIRTSPGNLADLRKVLESIDRPPRRLVILVRQGATAEEMRRGAGARVDLRPGDSRVDVRIADSRSASDERVDQRVQVLEGGRAMIGSGESRPLQQRQVFRSPDGRVVRETTTTIQQASTGFEVVPRLSGDTVHLDIAPQRESFVAGGAPGAIQSQRVATTVSGRLGEWIEIGGASTSSSRSGSGILSSGESRASGAISTWVKVEELRN